MDRGTLILNGVAYGGSGGGGSSVPIIDNLTSDDTDKALSVNQGKILKELVDDTKNTISNVYLSTRDYLVGDYCSYNNKLYKVIANCKGVTPPNTTYYEETTIAREQGGIRLGIDSDGNYGYYKVGADTLTPFKSGGGIDFSKLTTYTNTPVIIDCEPDDEFLVFGGGCGYPNGIVGGIFVETKNIAGTAFTTYDQSWAFLSKIKATTNQIRINYALSRTYPYTQTYLQKLN